MTLLILVLAFGSLVAAGLPLMLTIIGLMAAAGSFLPGHPTFDISIWAMNFAMMFALALGIDYAPFIVYRNPWCADRTRRHRRGDRRNDGHGRESRLFRRDCADFTSAVLLVPSPAFR